MLTRLSFLKVILFLGSADASQNHFISVLYTIDVDQNGAVAPDMRWRVIANSQFEDFQHMCDQSL